MNLLTPFQLLQSLNYDRVDVTRPPCVPRWIQAAEAPLPAAAINARSRRRQRAFRYGQNSDLPRE